LDVAGKPGFEGNFPWKYFGPGGNQKYVVEGETFGDKPFLKETHRY